MVYIKKIEMKGFKSYGNRKVSVPLSKGFTCIIGPNGSGKSNIADALLFVLGGLSAKSMRAEVFSDLIYASKNTDYAEVSLHFDNSDEKFPIDKNKIVITRKVFKDGRSVYRVNKKRETRTYVLDLLLEAHVVPDGYNIVHQGEIMDFINITSVERRKIIEEISGIAEFEEKKERGMRELEKTEENLARVELITNEVRKQMDRLENEKNDALRYDHLKSKIQKLKGVFVHSKLKKYKEKLVERESSIEEYKKKIEKRKLTFNSSLESIKKLEEKLERVEGKLDKKNEEYFASNEKKENLKRRFSRLEQDVHYEEKNLEKNRSKIKTLKRERNQLSSEINTINEDSKLIKEQKVSLQRKIISYEEEINTLEEAINEKTEHLQRDYDLLAKKLEKKKELFYTEKNELNSLKNKESFLNEKLKEDENVYNEKTAEYSKNKSDFKEYSSQLENIKNEILKYESEIEKIQKNINTVDKDLWRKKEEYLKLKSEIKAKKSFDMKRNKPYREVKRSGINGIYGRIKDNGKVTAKHSTALEVAGGRRLNYVIVDTDKTAKKCIKYLKEKKIGRCTFIPLDKIKKRFKKDIKEKEGFIDYAINLVEFNEELKPAFEYVFGDTLVIENIDCAKNFESFRRVTLDGDLIERSNVVTGGFYRPKGGFQIKEKEEKLEKMEKRIKSFKYQKNKLENELIDQKKKLKPAKTQETELQTKVESLKRTLKGEMTKSEISELKDRIRSNKKNLEKIRSEISILEKELSELTPTVKDMESKKESLHSRMMEKSGEDLKKFDALKKEHASLESEYQRLGRDHASKKSKVDVLNKNYSVVLEKIQETKKQSKVTESIIEEHENAVKEVRKNLTEIEEEVRSKKGELGELRKKRSNSKEEIHSSRIEKEKLEKIIADLNTNIRLSKQKNQENEKRIKELSENAEKYTETEIVDDIKTLEFKIKRMEIEKEGLEPINMRAVEECESTEERYLMLKTKDEKILREKKAVLEFIDKVETRKRAVFMATFNGISENFSDIFLELSGGEGDIFLENVEEPFEAGVDIETKPHGKELKRTAAMSGGEKALTALAFIFAIQRYKPAPFYLFDEIDAHLDDDNVKKVAEMIKKASEDSQFIIITLRDIMMSSADRLFGVSMLNEISEIVAVELQDTQRYKGKKFEIVEEA